MSGGGLAEAAQAREQVQPVAIGQAQVEQHDVERLHRERRPGRVHGLAHVHRVTGLAQRHGQAAGDTGIVFHHKCAHVMRGLWALVKKKSLSEARLSTP